MEIKTLLLKKKESLLGEKVKELEKVKLESEN